MSHEERQALIREAFPTVRVIPSHLGHAGVTFEPLRLDGPQDLDEHDYFSRAVYSSLDRDERRDIRFQTADWYSTCHINGCL